MLAGQPPFQGTSFPLVAHQVIMGTPPPIAGVSRSVQAVVDRALEKDPAKRYRQARELVADLRRAVGGNVVGGFSAPTLHFGEPREETVSFKTAAWIGAGAVAFALSVLIGIHFLPLMSGSPQPITPQTAITTPAAPQPKPAAGTTYLVPASGQSPTPAPHP